MKLTLRLLMLHSFALLTGALRGAVNIDGTTVYVQSFDALPTEAFRTEFDWTDDATIPGFYLHRSNAPVGEGNLAGARTAGLSRPYVSDGSEPGNTSPNFHGFVSLGHYGSDERSLGTTPATNDSVTNWCGGTLSIVALFTNTGPKPVDLNAISFELENWRANSNPALVETITLSYKTGPATVLLTELETWSNSATFIQTGYRRVGDGAFDYSSPDGFLTPAVPGSSERSGILIPPIRIAPGESVVLRWGNANESPGADAQVGLDNLMVRFVEPVAVIEPVVSGVVRHENGTPADPDDDTVDFTLTVGGSGNVSPAGWRIVDPAILDGHSGTYGTAKTLSGIPVFAFSPVTHSFDFIVEDRGTPAVKAWATATAPWCTLAPSATGVIRDNKGTADAIDDTWGYSFIVAGTFTGTGWTSDDEFHPSGSYGAGYAISDLPLFPPFRRRTFIDDVDPLCVAVLSVSPPLVIGIKNFGTEEPLFSDTSGFAPEWIADEAALTQRMTAGGGPPQKLYRSAVIDLTGAGAVEFSAALVADDTSNGFEPADAFNAQLIIDGDTSSALSLVAPHDFSGDGILTGGELTPAVPGNPPFTGPGSFRFPLSATIPASANSVQLVVAGAINGISETITVQGIVFNIAPDSDGDGMDDAWETANGLLPFNAGDKFLDLDQDGQNNFSEFDAGTAANDPASLLTIVSGRLVAGGYALTWTSVSGRKYRIQSGAVSDPASWVDLTPDIPAATGSSTTPTALVFPGPAPRRLLLRVRVVP